MIWPFRRKTRPLTRQQYRVLKLMAQGLSNKEIACNLHISHQTAKNHVSAVLDILDVPNRTKAVVKAAKRGMVEL